ncbi:unnamed protein product [Lupinus luteus]|uniref:Uncharacterized protein n=1 Tax=Lupinus luteus TaxID=3873 RepID=A0AAV1W248_LUPLU
MNSVVKRIGKITLAATNMNDEDITKRMQKLLNVMQSLDGQWRESSGCENIEAGKLSEKVPRLFIATNKDEPYGGEFVPGPCTHRPSGRDNAAEAMEEWVRLWKSIDLAKAREPMSYMN